MYYVGLTDVAALLGVTRQNVRKLMLGCDAPAPSPVVDIPGHPLNRASPFETLTRHSVLVVVI